MDLKQIYSNLKKSKKEEPKKTRWISKTERKIFLYLRSVYGVNRVKSQYVLPDSKSLHKFDIAIPDKKLIIEYDGTKWHSSRFARERDASLDKLVKKMGWQIIRIKERDYWNKGELEYVKKLVAQRYPSILLSWA